VFYSLFNILKLSFKKFIEIDGAQRAAAFSYYAFISIFPLIILLISIGSTFLDANIVSNYIFNYIENYFPLNENIQKNIFSSIQIVLNKQNKFNLIALIVLVWGSIKFINSLILANFKVWNIKLNFLKLPLTSILILIILFLAIITGVLAPLAFKIINKLIIYEVFYISKIFNYLIILLPIFVLFIGLTLFYKLSLAKQISIKSACFTSFFVSIAFFLGQNIFMILIKNYFSFTMYGAFTDIIIFLFWIYFTGYIIILGSCFSYSYELLRKT